MSILSQVKSREKQGDCKRSVDIYMGATNHLKFIMLSSSLNFSGKVGHMIIHFVSDAGMAVPPHSCDQSLCVNL